MVGNINDSKGIYLTKICVCALLGLNIFGAVMVFLLGYLNAERGQMMKNF